MKIVIVDDNALTLNLLTEIIKTDPSLEIAGTAGNGHDAYKLIKSTRPDVVLSDIIMPHADGLDIIERIYTDPKIKKIPCFIVISSVSEPKIIQTAFRLGASYYLNKPFSKDTIIGVIRQLTGLERKSFTFSKQNSAITNPQYILENEVSLLLSNMGFATNTIGFHYLIDAISLVVNNDNFLESVTKQLYPTVALRHNTNSQKVERNIRHSIETTWDHQHPCTLNKMFAPDSKSSKDRPTNSEFIKVSAKIIHKKAQYF